VDGFLKIEALSKAYRPRDRCLPMSTSPWTRGEFVCIIGHSGCGKTTILNVLAGLDRASSGHVFMDGREVAGPSLDRGVVFQGHALMPWLSVRQNIAFAVRSRWPDWMKAASCVRTSRSTWPWWAWRTPSTKSPASSRAA
jgi:nitrate/nitrite transport system ATP-binding protein